MLNKVLLMGRLTRDPEVRYTANNNTLVCRYSLAVGRNFAREGQPDVDFINVVAFGKTGEFCSKYFTKGQQVCVCGRLQTGSYDDKDGKKVYTTDVIAEEAHFADTKRDNANGGFDAGFNNAGAPENNSSDDGFMAIVDDEHLPF